MVDEAVEKEEAIEHPEPRDMFTFTCENLAPRQVKPNRRAMTHKAGYGIFAQANPFHLCLEVI